MKGFTRNLSQNLTSNLYVFYKQTNKFTEPI